jgi:hypothetical protein
MPKRPRQAHIPQQTRRRKVRRPGTAEAVNLAPVAEVDAPAEPIVMNDAPLPPPAPSVGRRRLELVQQRRQAADAVPLRTVPGQLPVLERRYIVSELRGMAVISSLLLALIIVLTLVLR